MSPIPDAKAGPKEHDTDPQYWSECPECGCLEHHFNTPGLFEIYQVCNGCVTMSENKHYLAGSPEAEAWKKQKMVLRLCSALSVAIMKSSKE